MTYQHPLAYLLGLEGHALLRGWAGDYDRAFVEERLAEIVALLGNDALTAKRRKLRRRSAPDEPSTGVTAGCLAGLRVLTDGSDVAGHCGAETADRPEYVIPVLGGLDPRWKLFKQARVRPFVAAFS